MPFVQTIKSEKSLIPLTHNRTYKTIFYPAILTTAIISSFIIFRIVGSIMVGSLSSTQLNFLTFEIVEVTAGVLLLIKEKTKISLPTSS